MGLKDSATSMVGGSGMPPVVKAGVAVVATGSVLSALVFVKDPTFLLILGVGAVLVVALIAGYKFLLKQREKGRSSPFIERIMRGSSPAAAADPAKKALEDDMRREFEKGIETFRSNGKDVYSLPWYVIAGPPGCGKTEAIRRCGVGFPPGLQNYLQGVGGTRNMHWWFTNMAVLLDTAGRMFMDESSEWPDFLKQLKQSRPNCPINGLILCIGIDNLIKDSAAKIEQEAGIIARRLDVIQRTLDVRFPVYVVVTKCDLINGFREFFDDIEDPQLINQLFGWSNPAGLDQKFEPAQVEEHLQRVKAKLMQRRMGLLRDPVSPEGPMAKRTDDVDAMFALPDALMKISSRLRRYLELIFVAGEWSPKPLFLRGIYFTTSMRTGNELDAELAELMGVPVDAIPGGKDWADREKSYFLRDMFVEKVFPESGLVTRATNVAAEMRRRQRILIAAGFITILVLVGVGFLGWQEFNRSVGKGREFWVRELRPAIVGEEEGRRQRLQDLGVVKFDREGWFANTEFTSADDKFPLKSLLEDTHEEAQRRIEISTVFRPLTALLGESGGNLQADERLEASRRLVHAVVLAPALSGARDLMSRSDGALDANGVAALGQLIRAETLARSEAVGAPAGPVFLLPGAVDSDARDARREGRREPAGEGQPGAVASGPLNADALISYVLREPGEREKLLGDGDRASWTQRAVDAALPADLKPEQWPEGTLSPDEQSIPAIQRGLEGLEGYFQAQMNSSIYELGVLRELAKELGEYSDIEGRFLADPVLQLGVRTNSDYGAFYSKWQTFLTNLRDAVSRVGKSRDAARARIQGFAADASSLESKLKSAAEAFKQAVSVTCDRLQAQLPPPIEAKDQSEAGLLDRVTGSRARTEPEDLAAIRAGIESIRTSAQAQADAAAKQTLDLLAKFSSSLLASGTGDLRTQSAYEIRAAILEEVSQQLPSMEQAAGGDSALARPGSLAGVRTTIADATKSVEAKLRALPDAPSESIERGARGVLAIARAKHNYNVAKAVIDAAPQTVQDVRKAVAARLPLDRSFAQPVLPLSRFDGVSPTLSNEFHPDAAKELLDSWNEVGVLVSQSSGSVSPGTPTPPEVLDADALRERHSRIDSYRLYGQEFAEYWAEQIDAAATVQRLQNWEAFRGAMSSAEIARANERLKQVWDWRVKALGVLPKTMTTGASSVQTVDEALRRITAQRQSLDSPEFIAEVGTTIKSVRNELAAADAAGARRVVLDWVAQQEVASKVPAYRAANAPGTPGIVYWNSLVEEALRLLVQEHNERAAAALQRLQTEHGFPLYRDATTIWSRERLLRAKEDIQQVQAQRGPGGAGGGEIREKLPDGLVRPIQTLLGASLVRDPAENEKLVRLARLIDVLVQEQGVSIVPQKTDALNRKSTIEGQRPVIAIDRGQGPTARFGRDDLPTNTPKECLATIPPTGPFSLVMYPNAQPGAQEQGRVTLHPEWGILWHMLQRDAEGPLGQPVNAQGQPVRGTEAVSRDWLVAVPTGVVNQEYIILRVTLDRELPASWPAIADAPRAP
ncbi:MAG: type VI secretion protein IcmF/TssM N-terminal domain-containing protein [Planctomycetota bacterium]|nr:type VI secretion protein IcmF/TssM N-terminal domain-containing protein [Planctomycetota bacterium]